jgi:hypothetical protein
MVYLGSKHEANSMFGHIPNLCWEFKPASYGRTGINSMFNHGPEHWLTGTLGIVIARVPASIETEFDGVNIRSSIHD